MTYNVTVERAISFTKLSVALTCTWPLPPSARNYQVSVYHVLWWTTFVSAMLFLLPLLDAIYVYSGDPVILVKTACLCSAVMQLIIKMALCRIQRKRFQALHAEMEAFCKHANNHERNVLQNYVNGNKYGYAAYMCWCYFATFAVISAPLYFPQTFPTHAVYPFSTKNQPVKMLIYVHQSLVGFQASAALTISCQVGLLLWYIVARFELLTTQFKNVTSEQELDVCIKKHNEILRFSNDLNLSIRSLVFTTVTTTTLAMIFGSLNLITNQPMLLKMLYVDLVLTAATELFICARPADRLKHMSENISWGAYCSNWLDNDVKLQKKILQTMIRCQKPQSIRINGILPELSLPYYASYVYTSFSYFTALKVIVS